MIRIFTPCVFALFFLTACPPKSGGPSQKTEIPLLNGAGASFPYILYLKWFSEYRKVEPNVAINYQSIGSGGGIRQFLKGTLDFGATDVPVSSKEPAGMKNRKIIHIPTALGAVALTYNLNLPQGVRLQFDGKTLSDIFQGKITRWNHPNLQELNKNVPLPDKPIVTVYRADGSGTTAFFTEFLAQSDGSFLEATGKGKSVQWPVGVGGKGNEGVVGLINKMEGAVGYISASYALVQNMPAAKIKNRAGLFVPPDTKAIMAGAEQAMKKNKNYLDTIINPGGRESYPLSGFTYIILSQKMPKKKGQILVNFLNWALTKGQDFSPALNFTPLPNNVRSFARKQLSQIQFQ